MAIRQQTASCQPAYKARDPSFEFLSTSMQIFVSIFNLVQHALHNLGHIKRNTRLQRSMSSSRENSPDRHIPRPRERGERRRHRHRTQGSKQLQREETTEDALDDFYGGTANIDGSEEDGPSYRTSHRPSQGRSSRPWTRTRPQGPSYSSAAPEGVDISSRIHHQTPNYLYSRVSDEDDLYMSEPPDGNWRRGEWIHAAKDVAPRRDPFPEHAVISLEPTLVVPRRDRRLTSDPFLYEKGWTDRQFAEELKYQYASLKLRDVGLFQKLLAYRQIHYVNVLQYRFASKQRKWMVVKSMPITNKGDKEGRDAFMYLLRYPRTSSSGQELSTTLSTLE